MSKRNLLVTSIMVGLFAITGCSEQTEDAAQNVGEDISQAAGEAATLTKEGVVEAGDAVEQTGEAIAEGGQELTTNPEGVVDEDQQY